MGYCTVEDILLTGITPKQFRLNTDEELNTLIESWITQATDIINNYCEEIPEDTPPSVVLACQQIVKNIILDDNARKNSPYVKINDWTVKTVPTTIFTDQIKDLLQPWTEEEERYDSSEIEFYTITGKD